MPLGVQAKKTQSLLRNIGSFSDLPTSTLLSEATEGVFAILRENSRSQGWHIQPNQFSSVKVMNTYQQSRTPRILFPWAPPEEIGRAHV